MTMLPCLTRVIGCSFMAFWFFALVLSLES